MDEIKKKLQEISDWADTEGRNAFIMVSEGCEQLTLTNTSIRNLAAMLAASMREEKCIARAVCVKLSLSTAHSLNLPPAAV